MSAGKVKLEVFYKNLGLLISKFRKEKEFSLEEVGLRIGLDRSAMHRIENGKPISITTIIKLSIVLNKEPKDFFITPFDFKTADLGGIVNSKKSPIKKPAAKRIKKN